MIFSSSVVLSHQHQPDINQEDSTREFFEESKAKLQALDMSDYNRFAISCQTALHDEKWSQILANQLIWAVF